jgi:hypothetical protein
MAGVDPTTDLSSLSDQKLAGLFNEMEAALDMVTMEISTRMSVS